MVGFRSGVKSKTIDNNGYTIIEVMIFLAVSAGLLVSVMAAISGQQQKTRFATGVRDFETKIQDIVNDVETGYYPSNGETTCQENGANLEVVQVPRPQGTNEQCVFLGKAIKFEPSDASANATGFTTTTIAGGRKQASSEEDTSSLDNARPIPFTYGTNQNGIEKGQFYNGVQLTNVRYWDSLLVEQSIPAPSRNVALVANIGTTTVASGSVTAAVGRPKLVYMGSDVISAATINSTAVNKAAGVAFCLKDGGTGRPAAVTLGIRLSGRPAPESPFQLTGQDFSSEVYFDGDAEVFGCD